MMRVRFAANAGWDAGKVGRLAYVSLLLEPSNGGCFTKTQGWDDTVVLDDLVWLDTLLLKFAKSCQEPQFLFGQDQEEYRRQW